MWYLDRADARYTRGDSLRPFGVCLYITRMDGCRFPSQGWEKGKSINDFDSKMMKTIDFHSKIVFFITMYFLYFPISAKKSGTPATHGSYVPAYCGAPVSSAKLARQTSSPIRKGVRRKGRKSRKGTSCGRKLPPAPMHCIQPIGSCVSRTEAPLQSSRHRLTRLAASRANFATEHTAPHGSVLLLIRASKTTGT